MCVPDRGRGGEGAPLKVHREAAAGSEEPIPHHNGAARLPPLYQRPTAPAGTPEER